MGPSAASAASRYMIHVASLVGGGMGFGGRGRAVGGRHEGEDCVEREGADETEAVDVSEMDFAAEEEESAEEEEEEDRARKVGVVH